MLGCNTSDLLLYEILPAWLSTACLVLRFHSYKLDTLCSFRTDLSSINESFVQSKPSSPTNCFEFFETKKKAQPEIWHTIYVPFHFRNRAGVPLSCKLYLWIKGGPCSRQKEAWKTNCNLVFGGAYLSVWSISDCKWASEVRTQSCVITKKKELNVEKGVTEQP